MKHTILLSVVFAMLCSNQAKADFITIDPPVQLPHLSAELRLM